MSTIKDVAKLAGVSTASVSHVINGTKNLTPETTEKILEAIKALNYKTNQTAKSFKTGRKNTIAFIVPDIANNYFANIIDALEIELAKSGYSLLLANTKENPETEKKHLRYLTSGIADGIVLASAMEDFHDIQTLIPKDFPIVLIDRELANSPLDLIGVSDEIALSRGIKKLLKKGHTRIGYIGDSPHISTAKARLAIYENCLKSQGISLDPTIIRHTSSLTHETYTLTEELLKQGCSAIVIGNNVMTVDAYCFLSNHQDLYPQVDLLGYQHKDLSRLFLYNCGIIAQKEQEMGSAAAKQILERLSNTKKGAKKIMIPNQLIV